MNKVNIKKVKYKKSQKKLDCCVICPRQGRDDFLPSTGQQS
jgi:hypothetical protein